MFKNFFTYSVFLVIVVSIIILIIFSSLLRHHYLGGERFKNFQKIAVFFAEIPKNAKYMLEHKTIKGDTITPINTNIYYNKKFFDKKISTLPREELILISRHDGDLGRSVVEIRDINTFEVIHKYLPNIKKIYEKIDLSRSEFKNLKKDLGNNKFYMMHPEIDFNGDLIFQSSSPLVKVDFFSNIKWVNDDYIYHHSNNIDEDGNIYVPSHKNPFSNTVAKYVGLKQDSDLKFLDDAINLKSEVARLSGVEDLLNDRITYLENENQNFLSNIRENELNIDSAQAEIDDLRNLNNELKFSLARMAERKNSAESLGASLD